MILNESDILNDTRRIIETVTEKIESEQYDMMVTDHAKYLMENNSELFDNMALATYLRGMDMSEEDYRFELETWVTESLEMLADELRNSDDDVHEWADGDQRVIYTGQTIDYYQKHTNEVEEKAEEYGATGSISEQLSLGVYGCIVDDYMEELTGLADDIESYDVEDFI